MTAASPTTLKKLDSKYDLVKFILSLLVMAIHTGLFPMVLYPWLRIAVPLFFMISSYFLFSKLQTLPLDQHKTVLKSFVLRNLKLYLCWFIILLPITFKIREELFFSGGFLENVLTIIKSILFGSTFVASWFIPATIFGVLIIYFLTRLLRKNYIVFFIALFSFIIVTLASSYTSFLADTFLLAAINKYIDIFGRLVCSFPAAIFFVFMGKLFAEQKIKFKSLYLLITLIILSAVGLFLEWKYILSIGGAHDNDSYFFLAPLCVLLFIAIQKLKPFYWKPSVRFKRASTIIYVSHGSVLHIVNKLVSVVLHTHIPLLSYILTFFCCIALYVFIEIAISKIPLKPINKILKMLY